MNAGKLILGVVAGVAAGAAIGVLFAPDKGIATRKKISKKGHDLADEMEGRFNKLVDTFSRKFNKLHVEANDLADEIKMKADEATGKIANEKK